MRRRRPPDLESYFPLQVGNTWVYRVNSRQVTSSYFTQIVTGVEQIGGLAYYVISSDTGTVLLRVRSDSAGRILDSAGKVLVNPATARRQSYSGPLGVFSGAVVRERCRVAGSD
jgi:hypothetical protein